MIAASTAPTIILGAGFAGLSAALHLAKQGVKVLVLEARDRIGGRVHREHGVELGASMTHGILGNPLVELLKEESIPFDDQAEMILLQSTGLPVEEPLASQLQYNVWSLFALRNLAQTTSPSPSQSLSVFLEPSSSLFANVPPSDVPLARSLGRSLEGWTGAKMEHVSLRWWGFEQDFEGDDRAVGGKGYTGLAEALRGRIEKLGGKIILNEEVVNIQDGGQADSDEELGDVVKITTASQNVYLSSQVICTLPLGVLKSHISPTATFFSPPLPPRRQASINRIGFGLLDKLVLHYQSPWWTTAGHPVNGWFFFAPPVPPPSDSTTSSFQDDPSQTAVGALAHSHPDGSASLVFFLGPTTAEALDHATDEEARAWGQAYASGWLGGPERKRVEVLATIWSRLTRWREDRFSLGSYAYIPPAVKGIEGEAASPLDILEMARPVWEGRLGFAGEHTSVDHYASVHAAWLSGKREAKRVCARMES